MTTLTAAITGDRCIRRIWDAALILAGICMIYLSFVNSADLQIDGAWRFALIAGMAFVCEYIDSSLGMGYGTTLTPLLLLFGYQPLVIVPCVLLSELVTGLSAGLLHHRLGNVDFSQGTRSRRIMLTFAGCALAGTLLAVVVALNVPPKIMKTAIGVMVLLIGLFLLWGKRLVGKFAWWKIIVLGAVAAFNKGASGGGYGPLVTGGQVFAGVPEKPAVAITSASEGLVCVVGFILYVILQGWPDWNLALPLLLGALASVPGAAWTVKLLPENILRSRIAGATLFLGCMTLARIFT
jgi:uncharacterized membrane protein YfcA